MARENKLPYLQSTDTGCHTKIIEDLGEKYKCYNYSTKEEIIISKADKILAKYEDDNEYHFHECDRAWIIGAMIEFAKSEVEKLNIHDVSKSVFY